MNRLNNQELSQMQLLKIWCMRSLKKTKVFQFAILSIKTKEEKSPLLIFLELSSLTNI